MSIIRVKDIDEYLNLIKEGICLVKFTASWCGPCKRIAPMFESLSTKFDGEGKFLEVDLDVAGEIANYENVQSIPHFLFYNKGKKYERYAVSGCNIDLLSNNISEFTSVGKKVDTLLTEELDIEEEKLE